MRTMAGIFAVALVAIFALNAIADDTASSLEGLKCPISKQPINPEKFVEHNGGKVYFCCGNCPKAFKTDNEDHVAFANHQLAASGQAAQAKCPISGGNAKDDQTAEVEGVTVKFCCKNCKGKVNDAEGAEKVKLVFSDGAFKKGYTVE